MAVTKRNLSVLLAFAWALGCKDANDVVLQPNLAAGSGAAAGATAEMNGRGGTSGTKGSAGTPGAAGGSSADAGGSAAGRGGSAAAGQGGEAGAAVAGAGGEAAGAGAGASSGAAGAAGGAGQVASGTGGAAGGEPAGARDADCDLTGIWAAKQVTVSEALALPQTSSNWYYLEFTQTGSQVEVSKHFDCGIEVRGSVTVTLSRATLEALLPHNLQRGRKATLMKAGDHCTFSAARFWSVRGGDEARFLPNGVRDAELSIDQAAAENPLPKPGSTDGAVDTENDGKLGVAFQVTGIISGTRNVVQRDWTEWFTEPGYEIPASTNWTEDIRIRADFDNEESILDPTSGLLVSGSAPKTGAKHVLQLRFLGRDRSDPRATAIVKATDAETCFAIQDALPAEQLE